MRLKRNDASASLRTCWCGYTGPCHSNCRNCSLRPAAHGKYCRRESSCTCNSLVAWRWSRRHCRNSVTVESCKFLEGRGWPWFCVCSGSCRNSCSQVCRPTFLPRITRDAGQDIFKTLFKGIKKQPGQWGSQKERWYLETSPKVNAAWLTPARQLRDWEAENCCTSCCWGATLELRTPRRGPCEMPVCPVAAEGPHSRRKGQLETDQCLEKWSRTSHLLNSGLD